MKINGMLKNNENKVVSTLYLVKYEDSFTSVNCTESTILHFNEKPNTSNKKDKNIELSSENAGKLIAYTKTLLEELLIFKNQYTTKNFWTYYNRLNSGELDLDNVLDSLINNAVKLEFEHNDSWSYTRLLSSREDEITKVKQDNLDSILFD